MKKTYKQRILIVVGILFYSLMLQAGVVKLRWTMPTNNLDGTALTDLAGAKIYYGTSSSNYTVVIDVGMTNSYTVTGLVGGEVYYLNGTAYNTSGLPIGLVLNCT